ncbi:MULTISPECIES: DUF4249 domain-containing protein [unclassified Carboxylicivirga]|uniref:DUF4249 domain-containing protein n=1 Tax=Carboxylicivirga TaxID=1628153 RepID=UPI003D349E63
MTQKTLLTLFVLAGLWSCLEPYEVNLSDYEDLLVVDALITDENKSHYVRLSRSLSNSGDWPTMESGAFVSISDQKGNEEVLTETAAGIYQTDPMHFIARVGSTYTLNIRTAGGEEYRSSPCTLLPKTDIDKVHFKASRQWNDDKTEEWPGLDIMVDGDAYQGAYVRWLYEEDWKFEVPFPTRIEYNYSTLNWEYVTPKNEICWKNERSSGVFIHSFANQESSSLKNKKVCFVPSLHTDKLTVRYSILVRQLSISQEEYAFWNKLKISTENVGDVFGTQPFSIQGNVENVNEKNEPVLGYFQTGSVTAKRLYINRREMDDLGLPIQPYDFGCSLDSFMVDGFSFTSALQIYEEMVLNGNFHAHDGIYPENGVNLVGLMLSREKCADCRYTGDLQAPDFWVD